MKQESHSSKGASGGGSLADAVAIVDRSDSIQAISVSTVLKVLILAGLVVAMNYSQFPAMLRVWLDDPNWSHGFIIPLFSLYLFYARRGELLAAKRTTNIWGLALLIVSGLAQVATYWINNPWSGQVTMLGVLLGLVLYLGGWEIFKLTWLPILFLVFAMPIPGSKYSQLALPLQNIAAKFSAMIISAMGITIEVRQSSLLMQTMSGQMEKLSVEEACSGVRLLMAFVALSVAMAYLADRPLWQRVIMVTTGIPIAIICNILRVTITCMFFYFDRGEFGRDFMHEFTGMVMLIPAFMLLWLLGKLLSSIYVDQDEDDETEPVAEGPA